MIRPELASAGCSGLDIDLPVDLPTRKALSVFGKRFSSRPEWEYLAYQEYVVDKQKYYCYLVAHHRTRRPSKRKAELHIHLSIRLGESPPFARMKAKLEPALKFLESHAELMRRRIAEVRARYVYPGDKYAPHPDLLTSFPLAGFEGSEIAGVRINFKEKILTEKPQVSIIVERIPDGRIHHYVTFSYKVSDVEKFLPTVLNLSKAISRKFIREKTVV